MRSRSTSRAHDLPVLLLPAYTKGFARDLAAMYARGIITDDEYQFALCWLMQTYGHQVTAS